MSNKKTPFNVKMAFNAKIKAFRASLRGVIDIKFFLFRLTKIYA
jgi:transposase